MQWSSACRVALGGSPSFLSAQVDSVDRATAYIPVTCAARRCSARSEASSDGVFQIGTSCSVQRCTGLFLNCSNIVPTLPLQFVVDRTQIR
jgi:hypothetical protein